MKFTKGSLVRQIGLLGLSQAEFAAKAGVNPRTVSRACQGQPLRPKSWGLIVRALGELGEAA